MPTVLGVRALFPQGEPMARRNGHRGLIGLGGYCWHASTKPSKWRGGTVPASQTTPTGFGGIVVNTGTSQKWREERNTIADGDQDRGIIQASSVPFTVISELCASGECGTKKCWVL